MNIPAKSTQPARPETPSLANGDCMTQAEFHRRYEEYPDNVKFELIGGIVYETRPFRRGFEYMASPLKRPHGKRQLKLAVALELYESETPGLEILDNVTHILGEKSEPQPDLCLRILEAFGGQSRETPDEYVEGGPELIAEIALSSKAIDLHRKREVYELAGVREYMVLNLEDSEFVWLDFAAKVAIELDNEGVARSRVFPGLWLNIPALLAGQRKDVMATMSQGLQSPEHAAFVKKLEAAKK